MDYELMFWVVAAIVVLGFIVYVKAAYGPSATISEDTLARLK